MGLLLPTARRRAAWSTNIDYYYFAYFPFTFLIVLYPLITSTELCVHKSVIGRPGQTARFNPNKRLSAENVAPSRKTHRLPRDRLPLYFNARDSIFLEKVKDTSWAVSAEVEPG